ncbi:MAG TPA: TOBE domain-containing protein [Burkholderiaceae bacterium]
MKSRKIRPLVGKIAFETARGGYFGEPRIRLLEAIGVHGSLSRAAKDVPLSYKAAWDALDAMNNLSEAPLVVRTTGGRHGGGTQLTDHGREIIALYRAMESSQQDILNQLAVTPAGSSQAADQPDSLRTLIRRMSVRTSARNQFVGTVAALEDAGGMVDVRLALAGGDAIVAAITPASVENMGLAVGSEAYALVKAPWVLVSPRPQRRSAARNVLAGTITDMQPPGAASTQVSLTTPNGRIVVASMANTLVAQHGLCTGHAAFASFSTESVILATFD